ncbi:hypothetical protein MTBUT4_80119 [Magnetospirillum sp. UT-4]|nr:hypothetical protein MTBUT4_80119 [Magnetospirillum sp. UT-4]
MARPAGPGQSVGQLVPALRRRAAGAGPAGRPHGGARPRGGAVPGPRRRGVGGQHLCPPGHPHPGRAHRPPPPGRRGLGRAGAADHPAARPPGTRAGTLRRRRRMGFGGRRGAAAGPRRGPPAGRPGPAAAGQATGDGAVTSWCVMPGMCAAGAKRTDVKVWKRLPYAAGGARAWACRAGADGTKDWAAGGKRIGSALSVGRVKCWGGTAPFANCAA